MFTVGCSLQASRSIKRLDMKRNKEGVKKAVRTWLTLRREESSMTHTGRKRKKQFRMY